MKITKKLFILSILFFTANTSIASYMLHKAHKLDLSNNAILSMYQDKDGYMWFGTYDGLNLYNGKKTYVYRFEMDNKNSLCSNIIHKISKADEDHLWISTFLGLNKFSLKERKVVESHTECPEAKLIATDTKGNTWVICRDNYIMLYTPETGKYIEINASGIVLEHVVELFVDEDDKLNIIMSNGAVKKVDSIMDGQLSITEYKLHENKIRFAFRENGDFYIVDESKGLYLFNTLDKHKEFLTYLPQSVDKYGVMTNVLSFNNNIYLSFIRGGIIEFSKKEGSSFTEIMPGGGVFSMIRDKDQDLLWIGTDGQGVQMYYQNNEIFKSLTYDSSSINLQRPVRSIYTDEYNNLWIGTKGDGIVQIKDFYQQSSNKFKYNKFTTENGLSSNSVFCFLKSEYRNIIWIGTQGPGISYYSYKDNKIKTLKNDKIGKVHSICEVNASTLWLATAGDGLLEVILNEENSQLSVQIVNEYYLKKGERICKEFHSMNYDGKTTLYVGSRGGYGLARFDIVTKNYDFINMNKGDNPAIGDVLCVHQSQDATFYVGASSGLTKIHPLSADSILIKQFDRRNGMANDMIHGILEDEDGCMWLSTNKGLTKYNPKNDFFHNYSHPELLVTEFSDDAYWKCPYTHTLFFGGVNGMVWVDSDTNYLVSAYEPNFYFFDLKVSGEYIPIDTYINHKGFLEIPADTHAFTVSFVALDYIDGESYEYSYILENYNTEWTELQKSNEIAFVNLPYGEYTLKVRYKNDVYSSVKQEYSLHIVKLTPWYLSVWAITVYYILFLLVCVCIIREINRRIARKQAIIELKIKEEQKEQLFEAKLDFYTNVTHELCTPLTIINGVTEHIDKASKTGDLQKYTRILKNNVHNLNSLIQEILDFRKVEEFGFRGDNIRRVLISDVIQRQIDTFLSLSEQNNIELSVSIPDRMEWNTDVSCFDRIIVNLLSNAFKYTPKGGLVRVSAAIEQDLLIVKVYNTGKGIEESKLSTIFDRYQVLEEIKRDKQYSQISSQNGLGLSICNSMVQLLKGGISAKSEINHFVEFTITLPLLKITKEEDRNYKSEIFFVEDEPIEPKINKEANTAASTILVVDDNEDIIWLLTEILSEEYTIKGANSAMEALSVLEVLTPVLIITDIMMPNMDGLEFINRVKENKFTKHIPLIVISAKISEEEQAEGLNTGADAYLTKPFSTTVLQSLIKRLLSTKEELKEYYYSPESAYEYSDGQLIHQEDRKFMDLVTSIIENNIEEENLRPELIAEKLGIDKRVLYRRFKKIIALSPNDFIKDYRFTLAAKLLVTTSLTVKEIIYKVGISNKSYFYREFQKKYNSTPTAYRSNTRS